jgi:3-oxoacyl-[acyl-carrier-protein] synthase-3
MQNIKIIGTGLYLPERTVTAAELDDKMSLRSGWVEKKSGVKTRRYVDAHHSIAQMGADAIRSALESANLTLLDLDCIVCGSATYDQPLPSTASLIKEKLQIDDHPIPAFDVDSTCLSFVLGFEMLAYLIAAGRYKTVAIVSSEIASRGLNYEQPESASLFGDGAAAVILTLTPPGESSAMLRSHMETYEKGAHMTEVRGGGQAMHPTQYTPQKHKDYLFDMDGRAVFRISAQNIDGFLQRLLGDDLRLAEIDHVVPHQASGLGLEHMQKKLGIPNHKFVNVIAHRGNMIAASIPVAMHEAIESGRISRGDKVMLIGTSAGLSIGGVVFVY